MTTTITEGLDQVARAVTQAHDAITADSSASPVTAAVVGEFASKAAKALAAGDRDAVVELEQAGDSAKVAAEADRGLAETTRQLVLDAHLAICMLKANTTATR
jgi:hypothetical protein